MRKGIKGKVAIFMNKEKKRNKGNKGKRVTGCLEDKNDDAVEVEVQRLGIEACVCV